MSLTPNFPGASAHTPHSPNPARTARPPRPSRLAPVILDFPLTPADDAFLARIESVLDLTLHNLAKLSQTLTPPAPANPAPISDPSVPSDLSPQPAPSPAPAPAPAPDPIPYARELNRALKALHTLCNIWTMVKALRHHAANPTRASLTADQADRLAQLLGTHYRAAVDRIKHHYESKPAAPPAAAVQAA